VIDRIFEPFFTTKEFGKGTGLGLSTTLAILKSHQGHIHAYSEVGRGTRFHVYLPAQASSVADMATSVQTDPPSGQGELVLVVDDEDNVRQITEMTLQCFGYNVLVASSGAEAVASYAARKDDIAVVLTDMMMPSMDGAALIRVLTQINPRVKIIAASGLDSNRVIAKDAAPSVCGYLPKPYTAQVLLETLQNVLLEFSGNP
jgi:CheY-like chemotaxis protein